MNEFLFAENGNLRAHYTKTTIRAGEILRLIAVFQDTRKCSTVSFGISGSSSEKDQYAQCLDPHGREVFASLSARGEFYAICQNGSIDTGSDAVLYKVHHLAKRPLPLRVSLFPCSFFSFLYLMNLLITPLLLYSNYSDFLFIL